MNDEQPATPIKQAEPGEMPSYGQIPWPTLRAVVAEAQIGKRDESYVTLDPSYSFGHQIVSMNWNSLNRIVSTFAATPQQPAAASAGASEDTVKCPGESALPTPTEMAEMMRRVARGFACPLCGWSRPHEHSPEEIIIYRNGVKYGRSGFAWTGADDQGIAEVARPDATAVGGEVRDGADEHHEHRAWQSSVDGPILEIHRRSAGLRGEDSVRGGAALQSPPYLEKYVPFADTPTPKAQVGTWILIAPDGREFMAASPMKCCQAEQRERVPAEVALGRIARSMNEDHGVDSGPRPVATVSSETPVRWLLEYTFNGEEKGSSVYESEAACKLSAERDGGVCVALVRATPPAHPAAGESTERGSAA